MARRSKQGAGKAASRPHHAKRAQGSLQLPAGEPVYGIHSVEAVVAGPANARPELLWYQTGAAERRLDQLVAQAQYSGVAVKAVEREVLDQASQGGNHQGVIAFCPPLEAQSEQSLLWRLEDWQGERPPLLLVLDGVTDPHNLGACLRSVDAAGGHGVVIAKHRSAPLNATVRKIASGAAEAVPVYQVTNLARALDEMRRLGVWVFGTAGEASIDLYSADLRVPTALVMGAEGKGLRRLTREHCDELVKLPMAGQVSSLNVSVAAGISLFEAVRQRLPG